MHAGLKLWMLSKEHWLPCSCSLLQAAASAGPNRACLPQVLSSPFMRTFLHAVVRARHNKEEHAWRNRTMHSVDWNPSPATHSLRCHEGMQDTACLTQAAFTITSTAELPKRSSVAHKPASALQALPSERSQRGTPCEYQACPHKAFPSTCRTLQDWSHRMPGPV